MAKNKSNLKTNEIEFVATREKDIKNFLDAIANASRFKVGDYVIAFSTNTWDLGDQSDKRTLVTNSYGAPKKYKVVHVDGNGISYIKELNNKGNPVGALLTQIHVENGNHYNPKIKYGSLQFEIDPDYTDAIIMEDEEQYDPAVVQRVKSELFKEITRHNKALKVRLNHPHLLLGFIKTLKVGDVLWKSTQNFITITHLDPLPLSHNGKRLDYFKQFGKAVDSKGKEFSLTGSYFEYSAIYTNKPRSYKELKD